MLGDKVYQELWQANGINTEAVQGVIDDNIRAFIQKFN